MFKAFGVCLILFVSCSQEKGAEKKEKELITWSGKISNHAELKLVEEFKLDSVQFTDKNYRYLLQGAIMMGKERQTYSLLFKNHPLSQLKSEVIDWNFPLEKIDSSTYNCFFNQTGGGYYVKWINSENELRIFIREDFISKH